MELDKIAETLKFVVDTNDLTEYKDQMAQTVTTLSAQGEQYTAEALAAALLKMVSDAKKKAEEKKAAQEAAGATGDAGNSNSNVQRFFINIGMADGLDNDSMKKFITDNVHSVTDADFTDVYLKDTFSFFELPKTAADDVLKSLIGLHYGDREVNVELSEKKRDGGRRGGFGGGRGGFGGHRGGFGGGRSFGGGYGHRDSGYGDRGGYGHRDGGYDRGGRDDDRRSYDDDDRHYRH